MIRVMILILIYTVYVVFVWLALKNKGLSCNYSFSITMKLTFKTNII